MTYNEHIYAIQNIINKGPKSDDSRFSNALILHYMDVARLLLVKRKLDNRKFNNPANYQTLCIPLCEDTWYDCCNMPDLGCPILKSKFEIPKALTTRTSLYLKVMKASGEEIGYSDQVAYRERQYSVTKKGKPAWFISNNYLYVAGIENNFLAAVFAKAMFENPLEVEELQRCDSDENPDCTDPLDRDYPIDGELIDPMYKMVLQFLGISMKYPEDNINNARATDSRRDYE